MQEISSATVDLNTTPVPGRSPRSLAEFETYAAEWLAANCDRRAPDEAGIVWRDEQQDELDAMGEDLPYTIESARDHQRKLYEAGLAGITVPTTVGGQGLSSEFLDAFHDIAAKYKIPRMITTIGLANGVPMLLRHGTPRQQGQHIPLLLSGREIWCQLFSEPAAGSDLAAVSTTATRDGEVWRVNGTKVWTTLGHFADYGLLLARSDRSAPKHAGLTMFLVRMKQPGVAAKPIRQITGNSSFNMVYLDDAVVDDFDRLGDVGSGWRVATDTLSNERTPAALEDVLGPVVRLARLEGRNLDPVIRQRLASLYMQCSAYDVLRHRVAAGAVVGGTGAGPLLKLLRTRILKEVAQLSAELFGASSAAWETGNRNGIDVSTSLVHSTRLSIAGGTDEVVRGVVGERILGLPREPRAAG